MATAFAGVHTLLTQAIKTRTKDKDFATALKEFGLTAAFADEVNRILVTRYCLFARAREYVN